MTQADEPCTLCSRLPGWCRGLCRSCYRKCRECNVTLPPKRHPGKPRGPGLVDVMLDAIAGLSEHDRQRLLERLGQRE